uniref:Ribonuclease H-like domain-containing protein n=1 Tax=Tanacetum cinerariifolium TaxID=118510 RepID=A0A6L2MK99_TANCI|nr:ribonuclease H-like domain-containing protein [Tanacetum cinerariifolium]
MPEYYHTLKSIWREFNILTLLPACSCAAHKSNLLAKDPLPDVKDAFAIVSREESYRGLAPVLFCEKNSYNNVDMSQSASTSTSTMSASSTNEQMMKLLSLINKKPAANVSGNMSDMFNVVDISSLRLTVGHPNDTMGKITAICSLKLIENVVLFDVLVVPKYNASLLSVNKMIKDINYFIGFNDCKCYIQDLKLGNILRTRSESRSLYMFDCDNSGKSYACLCNSGFVCYVFKELWHCKLGHPSNQVLSVLSDKVGLKSSDHMFACDICYKAKQTRDPFPLSDHKSSKLGDLVHLDVWDPYKVTSKDGYKYFLTVVVTLVGLYGYICLKLNSMFLIVFKVF